jgi:hypothetical protein
MKSVGDLASSSRALKAVSASDISHIMMSLKMSE